MAKKATSIDMQTQKPIYFARSDGNRGLGLLPRFIKVLEKTVLQGIPSLPEPANSLEVEIYWVTDDGLKVYREDMAEVNLTGEGVFYNKILSGEFGEIFSQYQHRFGPHTTVVALIGGDDTLWSGALYNKELGRIQSQHTVLFSHSNNLEFEEQKAFAQINSDFSHIVNNPTDLAVLTKAAASIGRKILTELRK